MPREIKTRVSIVRRTVWYDNVWMQKLTHDQKKFHHVDKDWMQLSTWGVFCKYCKKYIPQKAEIEKGGCYKTLRTVCDTCSLPLLRNT